MTHKRQLQRQVDTLYKELTNLKCIRREAERDIEQKRKEVKYLHYKIERAQG